MRYKTKYSESEDYTIYKYFHYTPKQLGIRGFLATAFAAITMLLLTPSPDEIIVIPAIAKGWQQVLQAGFDTSVVYAYATYKGIGLLFLLLTLLFGYQYLRDALRKNARHIRKTHTEINKKVREVHEHIKKHTEPKPLFYYKIVARKK